MVAVADYYVIESVHGVRQRIPLHVLRQRHAMMRQASNSRSTDKSTVSNPSLSTDSTEVKEND